MISVGMRYTIGTGMRCELGCVRAKNGKKLEKNLAGYREASESIWRIQFSFFDG